MIEAANWVHETFGIPVEEALTLFRPSTFRRARTFRGKEDFDSYINAYGIPHRIRMFVFERDNFTCHYCGVKVKCKNGRGKNVACVDHVIPRSDPRCTHKINNLVTSCLSCNSKKNDNPYNIYIQQKTMLASPYKRIKIESLKEKAFTLYKEGLSSREVAKMVDRSHTWVANAMKEKMKKLSTEGALQ